MNLITHKELVHISKKFNLGFSLEFIDIESLKLTNHHHPFSLTQEEAYIIYNLLLKNNAKNVVYPLLLWGRLYLIPKEN